MVTNSQEQTQSHEVNALRIKDCDALGIDLPWTPRRRGKVGRPTYRSTITKDLIEMGITWREAKSQDKVKITVQEIKVQVRAWTRHNVQEKTNLIMMIRFASDQENCLMRLILDGQVIKIQSKIIYASNYDLKDLD
ncbi:hypothetical protein BpHYR1_021674 [Brachionus plicatilis]|uniref:Uncharacterized protein n=1 Tax=Brachionus plicatilis TaxID=10195 RepID=A0A3M7RUQ9_BRAPC|nr:hypothetical protein BpHYR1_021674 [Brachionus plicatilis]